MRVGGETSKSWRKPQQTRPREVSISSSQTSFMSRGLSAGIALGGFGTKYYKWFPYMESFKKTRSLCNSTFCYEDESCLGMRPCIRALNYRYFEGPSSYIKNGHQSVQLRVREENTFLRATKRDKKARGHIILWDRRTSRGFVRCSFPWEHAAKTHDKTQNKMSAAIRPPRQDK